MKIGYFIYIEIFPSDGKTYLTVSVAVMWGECKRVECYDMRVPVQKFEGQALWPCR